MAAVTVAEGMACTVEEGGPGTVSVPLADDIASSGAAADRGARGDSWEGLVRSVATVSKRLGDLAVSMLMTGDMG